MALTTHGKHDNNPYNRDDCHGGIFATIIPITIKEATLAKILMPEGLSLSGLICILEHKM